MKIAFLYGKFSIGQRPLDFTKLYTSPRGLTGSELSCLEYARAMKRRGHDVMLVVGQDPGVSSWEGMPVHPLVSPRVVDGCDVVYSWNEPDLLREISPGPLRLTNQQLNDFGYCQPGWEEHVDMVTSPCAHHRDYLAKLAPNVKAWGVMPNGCDPTLYREGERVPGRVIWASSSDRGLHRLLEVWPFIKERAPHATLRAFYHFSPAHFDDYEKAGQHVHPDLLEIAQRKRYVRYAMAKLTAGNFGVEHVGSVSREQMAEEWSRAQVLGYSCETIRYTEGFSVTSMEACASGCLPVLTDVDSLGHIYGGAAPTVHLTGARFDAATLREFADLVIEGLVNEDWRATHVARCRALAQEHAWSVLAERLENLVAPLLRSKSHKSTEPAPTLQEQV